MDEIRRTCDRIEKACDEIVEHSKRPLVPSLQEQEVLGDLEEYPDMMQVKDIQEIFQIGNRQAYDLVKSEGFPGFRIGNSIRIPKHGLHLWANAQVMGTDFNEMIENAVKERMDEVDL